MACQLGKNNHWARFSPYCDRVRLSQPCAERLPCESLRSPLIYLATDLNSIHRLAERWGRLVLGESYESGTPMQLQD
jgi:hypothetical protein